GLCDQLDVRAGAKRGWHLRGHEVFALVAFEKREVQFSVAVRPQVHRHRRFAEFRSNAARLCCCHVIPPLLATAFARESRTPPKPLSRQTSGLLAAYLLLQCERCARTRLSN